MRVAVLATIIEQPGWRYDITTRFDVRFGRLLPVTDRRVYQVVDDLLAEGLVEVIHEDPRRRHFGATGHGRDAHARWLAEGMREDPERLEMRVGIVAASVYDQQATFELLRRYREVVLADMASGPTGPQGIQAELLDRERRMVNEASLRWIEYAVERLAREP